MNRADRVVSSTSILQYAAKRLAHFLLEKIFWKVLLKGISTKHVQEMETKLSAYFLNREAVDSGSHSLFW